MSNCRDNIQPQILATIWVLNGLAGLIVFLRFAVQSLISTGIDIDDYLILLSWLTGVINTSLITTAISFGVGRRVACLQDLRLSAIKAVKFHFLAQPWGISCAAFARISFAAYILKFTGTKKYLKWSLWFVIAGQIVINGSCLIQVLVQCRPLARLWNKDVPGWCMSPQVQVDFGYALGVVNCIHDLMLTFLPIAIVKDLKMKTRVKAGLALLMGLSIFGFATSIIKTIMISTLSSKTDFTYETVPFIRWFTIENYVTIICASIPSLRPLFLLCTTHPSKAPSKCNSYELAKRKKNYRKHKQVSSSTGWTSSAGVSNPLTGMTKTEVRTGVGTQLDGGHESDEEAIIASTTQLHSSIAGVTVTRSISVHYSDRPPTPDSATDPEKDFNTLPPPELPEFLTEAASH